MINIYSMNIMYANPPVVGWRDKKSSKNNCNNCTDEENCAGKTGNTTMCWSLEEPRLSQKDP